MKFTPHAPPPDEELTELLCEFCAPDSWEECDGGESDSPQHCSCGRPLEGSLTSDGITYVLDQAEETARDGYTGTTGIGNGPPYYVGSPMWAVVSEWIDSLSWYHLDGDEGARCEALGRLFSKWDSRLKREVGS